VATKDGWRSPIHGCKEDIVNYYLFVKKCWLEEDKKKVAM
jgi:hypothetical protein